eukprot:RCo029460
MGLEEILLGLLGCCFPCFGRCGNGVLRGLSSFACGVAARASLAGLVLATLAVTQPPLGPLLAAIGLTTGGLIDMWLPLLVHLKVYFPRLTWTSVTAHCGVLVASAGLSLVVAKWALPPV